MGGGTSSIMMSSSQKETGRSVVYGVIDVADLDDDHSLNTSVVP